MIDDRKSENVEPNQEEPKVMSDQERDNFHGLTLNEDGRRDDPDRKSTRLNSSHKVQSRMPSSA